MTNIPNFMGLPLRVIVIALFCVLLVSGCVSSSPVSVKPVNTSQFYTSQNLTTTPDVIPISGNCHQNGHCSVNNSNITLNETFISISPISNRSVGGIVTFHGTTDFAPGELIVIEVHWALEKQGRRIKPCIDPDKFFCVYAIHQVPVVTGDNGTNSWSDSINISTQEYESGAYTIEVFPLHYTKTSVSNQTDFIL